MASNILCMPRLSVSTTINRYVTIRSKLLSTSCALLKTRDGQIHKQMQYRMDRYMKRTVDRLSAQMDPRKRLTPAHMSSPVRMVTDGSKRRAKQLSSVLQDHIVGLLSSGEIAPDLQELAVEISEVRMLADMSRISVYWEATGDEHKDKKIEELLTQATSELRTTLTGLRVVGNVPPTQFLKDSRLSRFNEVERLLKIADMGPPPDQELQQDEELEQVDGERKQRVSKSQEQSREYNEFEQELETDTILMGKEEVDFKTTEKLANSKRALNQNFARLRERLEELDLKGVERPDGVVEIVKGDKFSVSSEGDITKNSVNDLSECIDNDKLDKVSVNLKDSVLETSTVGNSSIGTETGISGNGIYSNNLGKLHDGKLGSDKNRFSEDVKERSDIYGLKYEELMKRLKNKSRKNVNVTNARKTIQNTD